MRAQFITKMAINRMCVFARYMFFRLQRQRLVIRRFVWADKTNR